MTKLDELLQKVNEINERLFVGKESFQNRMTVIEESVMNCQRLSRERSDGYVKLKLAVFGAFVSAAMAALFAWFKK